MWPYDTAYRGHLSRALSLREDPFGPWHLLRSTGILFIIVGLPLFIFPFKIFGYSFLFGITIWIVSYPFVNRANKKQQKQFSEVMDEVTRQVTVEKNALKLKATAEIISENADEQVNINVVKVYAGKHFTPNWEWVRHKLLFRDKFRCCLCGHRVQLADSVAHHINAFSEGGKTEFSNLVTICVECHSVIHPWLNPKLNLFWIHFERGRVYCWKCKKRLDTIKEDVVICSDCGWLYHISDGACGCNYPGR